MCAGFGAFGRLGAVIVSSRLECGRGDLVPRASVEAIGNQRPADYSGAGLSIYEKICFPGDGSMSSSNPIATPPSPV
jgi:hypothetical protein